MREIKYHGASEKKPSLNKGEKYQLEIHVWSFPEMDAILRSEILKRREGEFNPILTGHYLGIGDGDYSAVHVFVAEKNKNRIYCFFDDDWITDKNDRIAYSPWASYAPSFYSEKFLKENALEKSKLLNILRELGEKL